MSAEPKAQKQQQQQQQQQQPPSTIIRNCTPKVLAADFLCACTVGSIVAVPISIVDFAIMAKVSGVVPTMMTQVFRGTRTLFTDPLHFFVRDTPTTKYALTYRLCAVVYVGTYIIANWSRSIFEATGCTPEATAKQTGVTSSAVNIGLTIWKDGNILKVMPRKEGQVAAAAAEKVFIPMLSRLGFAVRDGLTCVSAFTIVPLFKDYLRKTYPDSLTDRQAQTVSSLFCPCAVQIVSTNVHVPAIMYQRMYTPERRWAGPEGYLAGFAKALKTDYAGALSLRVLRIGFAFSCGTMLSAELRPRFIRAFEPTAFTAKQ